jgi:hypothetical protein
MKKNYSTLELLQKLIKIYFSNFAKFLSQNCQKIFSFCDSNEHIKVSKMTNNLGNTYWQLYNFHTRQSTCFSSEAEVRFWIEQQLARY